MGANAETPELLIHASSPPRADAASSRLSETVRAPRGGGERRAGVAHRLVMDRVQGWRAAEGGESKGRRVSRDPMHRLALAVLFPVTLEAGLGQVLVQGPAERDGDELD